MSIQHVRPLTRFLIVLVLLVMIMAGGALGGAIASYQSKKQGELNQEHIDCIIAISTYAQKRIAVLPPNCVKVRERMFRAGVIPENISPVPVTTTTAVHPSEAK